MSPTCRLAVALSVALCAALAAAEPVTLHEFAARGEVSVLRGVLAGGADVNAVDAEGQTALHVAIRAHRPEAAAALVAAGADVQARDARGRTPLHAAAQAGEPATLEFLLAAGADVNARDEQGETPLHLAARLVRLDVVRALLAAGADVGARDLLGRTPLHVAGAAARPDVPEAEADIAELAALLIAAGADPATQDEAGTAAWPRREAEPTPPRTPSGYPTATQIADQLLARANSYPTLAQRVLVGTSGQGRPFYALKISDNVTVQEDEPEFRWIANIHGDEVTGVMLCLNMIDYLLTNYTTLPRVANLVNEVEIWFIPTMNPDGYTNNTRTNAAGIDMNRNFPEGSPPSPEPNTTTGRAIEVQAIMNLGFAQSFTMSANYHGGALLMNYPFDNNNLGSTFSPTPDEDLFVYVSEQYAIHNTPMWNSTSFPHGITNGAAWYSIDGGLQDWSYRYMGCNDITIEISEVKSPPFSQIPTFWSQNQESMLCYMECILIGVRGVVTNAMTGAPLAATVRVIGRDHPIYTDPDVGDYHRLLLPGSYVLQFETAGYSPVVLPVTVVSGAATRLDVSFGPPPDVSSPNGGETLTAGVPASVTWSGAPTAQFHVQVSSNYGATGTTTDSFEGGALGSAYITGGTLPWLVMTGTAHQGVHAARAGDISHSQTTWMTRAAQGGPISFWYKVRSEANYDWFNFYVDGVQKVHRSGSANWTLYSQTLTAGAHTLKWEYVKDAGVDGFEDTVWVDQVSLTGDATTWTDIIALTPAGATSADWTPTTPGTTNKVRVRARFTGGVYSDWDESAGLFTVLAPVQGACCDVNGTCIASTAADCAAAGGTYQGDGTSCDPNPCPPPQGACCAASGACSVVTAADCAGAGGNYQGNGTGCDPNPCPPAQGACCFADAPCGEMGADDCATAGGTYQGDGTVCDPNPCPPRICRGDTNCDGTVGFGDIDYFVAAIPSNQAAWEALFPGGLPPGCTFENCDVDDDGDVSFADIDPFVALIPSACP